MHIENVNQRQWHAQINAFALSVKFSSVNSSTSQKITNDIFHNCVLPFLDSLTLGLDKAVI